MRELRASVGGLATRVWLPVPPPRAVLVVRTPYGAAGHAAEARGWTAHGIGLVVQDVRGRHESPGAFVPYAEEHGTDGPDLLGWVRSWADAPVVLMGTSYGAYAALATAVRAPVEGVVVAVPALGLGETARTRGGVLQLASRLGWWLAHDVRRPWAEVVTARRRDAERAAAVAALDCPLLAIGGTDDYFAHDVVDLWSAWGGPARLVLGPWDHGLAGAARARRILGWLDAVLDGRPPRGATLVDRSGGRHEGAPPMAEVRLAARPGVSWCASLAVRRPDGSTREIAHGAAFGSRLTLGPVLLAPAERTALELRVTADDFPRYARSPHPPGPVPDHHLELSP
ncbi:CocE/NonD family hydrolase [Nocardioides nitrophenolicus]|uniref:CocE/NonD family hydrolase n=1 Tax=Nocardioides nitrophenolicus TaxID=60489 RepID=UPI00195A2596|nr:CocE/NonD family hydrolase [Nocardioides nitrophenolicus]MBM7517266.1 putative acyl esterase [Nocardioides nitrophenolicus]